MCDEDFCVVIFEAISACMVSWYRKIIECCIDKKYIIVFLKGGGVLYQYGTNTKFIEIDLVSYYLSIFLKSWSLHCIPQCDMDADFSIVIMIVSELTPVGWLDRPFEWLVWMGFNRWKNMWYVSYIALNEGLSLNCSACTAV